jgi:hypothetical protein
LHAVSTAQDEVGALKARHLVLFFGVVLALGLASCGKSAPNSGPSPHPASPPAASSTAQSASTANAPGTDQPTPSDEETDAVDIGSVTITTEAGANGGAPIAVDIVFVYDDALAGTFAAKTAADWFQTKAALLVSNADDLDVHSWTVAPGQAIPETPIDAPEGVVAAFVFANYAEKGDHRLRIDGSGALSITLGKSDLRAEIDQ